MRKALLLLLAVSGVALAQGVWVSGTPSLSLTDCQPNGGDGGTAGAGVLTEGRYLMTTTGGDVTLCHHDYFVARDGGHVCPTGGVKYPQGLVMRWQVPRGNSGYSCRTDAGVGRIDFVPTN